MNCCAQMHSVQKSVKMLFATVINTGCAQKLDAAQIVILLIAFELRALLDPFLFVDYLMSLNFSVRVCTNKLRAPVLQIQRSAKVDTCST